MCSPEKGICKDSVFEDEVFDDSALLAQFDNSVFNDNTRSNKGQAGHNSALNVSALCCDEEISGYDKITGKTWTYPTNYEERDYQFNIIKAAILKNTMVSLPTGLGKTFIAAVIMYNFYRWYPLGKIVFTAPTRPLVDQQIDACYNIVAIPPKDTVKMTGNMEANTRKAHWQSKRVFFATPQVIYNDIKSRICPGDKIRCLVIDEAHKARGNYAYCQIVSTLTEMGHNTYRILALSATPGNKITDVVQVVKNLHITHLELRTESCIDVAKYTHAIKINTVIVKLDDNLKDLRQQYITIIDDYARRLKQFNILPQNLGNVSKGRIVMLYKEFQTRERGSRHPQHNIITKDLNLLISLYHGLELLIKHGSRVFLNFFDEHPEKSWMQADDRLTALLERLRDDLGVNPLSINRSVLPDGTIPEIPKNLSFGHPKFETLKNIMMQHFNVAKLNKQDTRAIVFCEYRDSVNLVHCLLLQCRPLIVPQVFVGQGAAGKDCKMSQKHQLLAMRSFREGKCNTLVATCVAEEGLDVGSVDIIVNFDISTRSPTRLVQRSGRTGRERSGQVYNLVTEGIEHQMLVDSMRQRNNLKKQITGSREVQNSLYKLNPRMIPHDFMPECQKMFITVAKKDDNVKSKAKETIQKAKKNQRDVRSLLGRPSVSRSASKKTQKAPSVTEEGIRDISLEEQNDCILIETTDSLPTDHNDHINAKTKDTAKSTTLILNIKTPSSVTDKGNKTDKKKKKEKPLMKSPNKKDGDIRAIFSAATKSTKNYTKQLNQLGILSSGNIPTNLLNLLVDLRLDNNSQEKNCFICQNICNCAIVQSMRSTRKSLPILLPLENELRLPDLHLIEDMDSATILQCSVKNYGKDESQNYDMIMDDDINLVKDSKHNCSENFDLQFDFSDLGSPENFRENKIIKDEATDKYFDLGDIEDILADSPETVNKETEENKIKKDNASNNSKDILDFFGLDSIDDIFKDNDSNEDNIVHTKPVSPDVIEIKVQSNLKSKVESPKLTLNNTFKSQLETNNTLSTQMRPPSPSILSGRFKNNNPISTSPVLGTQVRKFQLSMKKSYRQHSTPNTDVKRRLYQEPPKENNESNAIQTSLADTSNKSMLTITQIMEMIKKNGNENTIDNINESTYSNYENKKCITPENNRSNSPILLTQADKTRNNIMDCNHSKFTPIKGNISPIILDSDSDENTQEYEITSKSLTVNNNNPIKSPVFFMTPINSKRKYEDDCEDQISSPYFVKKAKLDKHFDKPLSLQEDVLAALASQKLLPNSPSKIKTNHCTSLNFTVSSPFISQKENKDPLSLNKDKSNVNESLKMLQQFRRDSKSIPSKTILSPQQINGMSQNKNNVVDLHNVEKRYGSLNSVKRNESPKHQKRKKKHKNEFLDLEAELSTDDSRSGDELSDESIGSIIDFICDDNDVTHNDEDMQAHYLKSVKSPVKGVFKIPQLPTKFNKMEVFSQFVEEDNYEIDSFCVDSHIGMTQDNEMSELEIAEMLLEKKRKKKSRDRKEEIVNGDSPIVVKKRGPVRRRIHSDSDDSS